MKKITFLAFLFFTSFKLCGTDSILYFSGNRLSEIRTLVHKQAGHFPEAYKAMKRRVDAKDLSVYGPGVNRYNRSYLHRKHLS